MGDALLGKWCGSGVLLYDAFYHLARVHCKYNYSIVETVAQSKIVFLAVVGVKGYD